MPAEAAESPTITRAVVDYKARTLTAYVVDVRANRRRVLPLRASLGDVPLTVNSVTVDAVTHTAVLTLALPDPIPVGSFLLQVAWGNEGNDDGLAFDVTLGAMGPVGAQGPRGPTGPAGPQGPTGAQGPQGLKGDTGIAGAKGDKGDQGIQGPAGADGLPGAKGDVGPQGPAGIPGAAGSALVTAKNWFLPGGGWSIPVNTLTLLPGSGFVADTTGGPLEIQVTLGGTYLQTLNQFSCMPVIDGVWAGRSGFGSDLQVSLPYVEGIEFNGTPNVLLVTWSRSRVYSGISAGTHDFEIRCWATGGPNPPLIVDFAVNSLTVMEIR